MKMYYRMDVRVFSKFWYRSIHKTWKKDNMREHKLYRIIQKLCRKDFDVLLPRIDQQFVGMTFSYQQFVGIIKVQI